VYIPEFNRIESDEVSLAFIKANPFAIVVSTTADGPFATHLPVIAKQSRGTLILRAHVAKANPHWKSFESEDEVLTIFHGPHAYISPRLYESRENVPTWNYAAAHVYGRPRILENHEELSSLLQDLTTEFDPTYTAEWLSFSPDYRARITQHIVGFEITVSRFETKFKLSQNRTKQEQENVIRALSKSSDSSVSKTADLMRQRRLGLR
jgi:transcriptional regulator